MARDDSKPERTRLDARVEAQTLYFMEMLRRLGASPGASEDEAARICSAVLTRHDPAEPQTGFCGNGDHPAARRDH